jgi:hypothetical protein
MATNLIHERQQAHELLDLLPPEQLDAVRSLLKVMVHPVETLADSLAQAPEETEELSQETIVSITGARASLARGEGIAHEEIMREFGIRQ